MSNRFTVELLKVHGSVSEILQLLTLWRPGLSTKELGRIAVAEGILGKSTEGRVKQLITIAFARRLLQPNESPATTLKILQDLKAPTRLQKSFLLLFTLRSSLMLQEVLRAVVWANWNQGKTTVSRDQVVEFFTSREGTEWLKELWTPTTKLKTSRSVLQTLADLGLLEDRAELERRILPFRMPGEIVAYLVHENRVLGRAPNALFTLPDWSWYGISPDRIYTEILQASTTGDYLVQYSGDLLTISFHHPTMEAYLNALSR